MSGVAGPSRNKRISSNHMDNALSIAANSAVVQRQDRTKKHDSILQLFGLMKSAIETYHKAEPDKVHFFHNIAEAIKSGDVDPHSEAFTTSMDKQLAPYNLSYSAFKYKLEKISLLI